MDKYLFFAVFEPAMEGGYTITFPDIEGCITEADDVEEGMRNAKEALELHLYGVDEDGEDIPAATPAEKIELKHGQFTIPVIIYMNKVRDEMENKAVSKTVTMPRWLRDAGEREKVNFSALLQDALYEKLGIKSVYDR